MADWTDLWKFVRYADNVTAVCGSYEDAQKIENCFIEHCSNSGIRVNEEKSPSIATISNNGTEVRNYKKLDYLGYGFSKDGTLVPEHVINRIKTKISRLIHIYLVHYPRKYGFNKKKV